MKDHPGGYLLAVEGNAPTRDGGVYCTVGGETFLNILKETAEHAKAIVAWGSCASNGCVQAAQPNPTGAKPVHKLITDKPIINVPGCPPIAEVMTGVLTYILTFDALPELDRIGRPRCSTASAFTTSATAGRSSTPASSSKPGTTTARARAGASTRWAAAGRRTYNSCSTLKWNDGVSFPIGSGHGCIGCSEAGFWDNGPFYQRLSNVPVPGIEATPETIGEVLPVRPRSASALTCFRRRRAPACKDRRNEPRSRRGEEE